MTNEPTAAHPVSVPTTGKIVVPPKAPNAQPPTPPVIMPVISALPIAVPTSSAAAVYITHLPSIDDETIDVVCELPLFNNCCHLLRFVFQYCIDE